LVAGDILLAMSAIEAVVTTGIYCRPDCSASPRPENVRSFALAAAAEAHGYRACLRCRPYRSTPALQWASGPELVCRAVNLVVAGALDDATEDELAARLGVSARHLRRLFAERLGVTPDGLARSCRVHFARRLLDDTDLSVAEIAFAAGFGSVRQLHRACHEVFRAPPRELRARRRRGDRLVADGGLRLRLSYDGPLDWEALLAYFKARAIAGVEHVGEDCYRRTVVVDGDPGVLELERGGEDHLLLTAHLPHWQGLMHVVARARRIFALDSPAQQATQQLAGDPTIGALLQDRPGLRVPGTWDPFETGVRAIVGQQVSVAAANTLVARLVARTGTPVAGLAQLGLSHTFPSPSRLATADLSGLGLTGARADAVRAFARAVDRGEVALDASVSLQRLVDSIVAVRGLGPWTAHYIALRMGEPDAFPADDLGLRRALARIAPAPKRGLDELAEHWSPWCATAATHLWLAPYEGDATLRTARRASGPAGARRG
jgi:AraC family transcriptional regulator, regulatory protein of adaptative response / DNA-3-methyladenine glycosylase II